MRYNYSIDPAYVSTMSRSKVTSILVAYFALADAAVTQARLGHRQNARLYAAHCRLLVGVWGSRL
jgi:hypothetical protein